jgi:hypothetical protein
MSAIPYGAAVRHRLTGAIGEVVKGPRRASRGMRWIAWDSFDGGGARSAPRLSSARVLVYVAKRHETARAWIEQGGAL